MEIIPTTIIYEKAIDQYRYDQQTTQRTILEGKIVPNSGRNRATVKHWNGEEDLQAVTISRRD